MACVDITHEVRQSSPARRCFGVLLALAICGLLTACGGDVTPSVSGGGSGSSGGGAVVCTYSGGTATVLNWSAVPNVNGYRVYYGTANSQYFQQFGQGVNVAAPATTYQVPNLVSGTTYYFAVTSYDAVAESVFSNEVCKIIL